MRFGYELSIANHVCLAVSAHACVQYEPLRLYAVLIALLSHLWHNDRSLWWIIFCFDVKLLTLLLISRCAIRVAICLCYFEHWSHVVTSLTIYFTVFYCYARYINVCYSLISCFIFVLLFTA